MDEVYRPDGTIENALEDDLLFNIQKGIDTYSFTVGELKTVVTIKLKKIKKSNQIGFWQSHFIHTPQQMDPYKTTVSYADNSGYALHRAISSITDYYREAVTNGHKPKEEWLVLNTNY